MPIEVVGEGRYSMNAGDDKCIGIVVAECDPSPARFRQCVLTSVDASISKVKNA